MPQLMPFYWINSVLMVLIILFSMMFMYNFKDLEKFMMKDKKNILFSFNFSW